jgi:ankyrin repeat protein
MNGNTALMLASRNGHGSIVDSLIRACTSVDIQDMNRDTALILTSRDGHGSIVDSLIQRYRFLYYNGVDPNPNFPNPPRQSWTTEHCYSEQLASLVSTSRAL